ncbi:flagellar biosynthesis anti-sigma factor FlgM [Lentibacillus sp.]|jgi:negative regulator of flagellin synthesis FlgM|uniref:flagellar biosynthesis anti-sigma factor FlgM n=1 Tax=Lentibacillus sp. TaxID=1925746 RepID=UPI002B4ABD8D|nr:flagellar biosynthesis anti-sigma factor FlgM [Lentibacillus sp.]HLS09734.1 flagellar biosynthesis anti-sigma factor FlgM [Lentibacillus sp.]
MKIYGPDQSGFNPYKYQMQKQMDHSKAAGKKDQLEISSQAKEMLENKKVDSKRAAYVQQIKESVDKGDYRINHEKTAQKMIDFWSKQS